jgi:hypothetical protein
MLKFKQYIIEEKENFYYVYGAGVEKFRENDFIEFLKSIINNTEYKGQRKWLSNNYVKSRRIDTRTNNYYGLDDITDIDFAKKLLNEIQPSKTIRNNIIDMIKHTVGQIKQVHPNGMNVRKFNLTNDEKEELKKQGIIIKDNHAKGNN